MCLCVTACTEVYSRANGIFFFISSVILHYKKSVTVFASLKKISKYSINCSDIIEINGIFFFNFCYNQI